MFVKGHVSVRVASSESDNLVHIFDVNMDVASSSQALSNLEGVKNNIQSALDQNNVVKICGVTLDKAQVLEITTNISTSSHQMFFAALGTSYGGCVTVPAQGPEPVSISL